MTEFELQDIAGIAWSFATMQNLNPPLLLAIAAASSRMSIEFGSQETVLLIDAGFDASMFPDLETNLHALATDGVTALESTGGMIQEWVREACVDRLGWAGTELMVELMGLSKPSRCIQQELASVAKEVDAGLQGSRKSPSDRVIAVAHLLVASAGVETVITRGPGSAGDPSDHAQIGPIHLRPIQLPLSRWVDRSRCSEFRVLEEVCGRMLTPKDLSRMPCKLAVCVFGAPPCLSCMAAVQQVRCRFPGLEIEISFRKSVT